MLAHQSQSSTEITIVVTYTCTLHFNEVETDERIKASWNVGYEELVTNFRLQDGNLSLGP